MMLHLAQLAHLIASLLLQAGAPPAPGGMVQLLWVLVPSTVSGLILLVGFIFVHKRFISHEFPGYVDRVESRLSSLDHHLEKIERSVHELTLLLTQQSGRIDHHDWRLRELESERGRGPRNT